MEAFYGDCWAGERLVGEKPSGHGGDCGGAGSFASLKMTRKRQVKVKINYPTQANNGLEWGTRIRPPT
jgi:hypothetical protein